MRFCPWCVVELLRFRCKTCQQMVADRVLDKLLSPKQRHAADRHPAGLLEGSCNLAGTVAVDLAFAAAFAEPARSA